MPTYTITDELAAALDVSTETLQAAWYWSDDTETVRQTDDDLIAYMRRHGKDVTPFDEFVAPSEGEPPVPEPTTDDTDRLAEVEARLSKLGLQVARIVPEDINNVNNNTPTWINFHAQSNYPGNILDISGLEVKGNQICVPACKLTATFHASVFNDRRRYTNLMVQWEKNGDDYSCSYAQLMIRDNSSRADRNVDSVGIPLIEVFRFDEPGFFRVGLQREAESGNVKLVGDLSKMMIQLELL